jgi:poly(3-hydroxybutyrate) depolymerase
MTGGRSATGGTPTGGAATGGKSAAGGANTGGQATGGKSAAGGANTGGQATGGKSAAGGASSTGGQATAGSTSTGGAAQSSGCGKAPGIPSNQYNNGTSIPITAAGMQRRYVLNVPTNYDNTKPYRLVVTLHARDGNDKQMYSWQYYGLLPLSNNNAIFVAPNGQLNGSPCSGTSSSGEGSCGWPNPNGQDLALVDAVVAQIKENFCVDTDRIFATGWSYGGSMSYDVACERPLGGTGSATWGVRAIAIYSAAQLSGNCTPKSPVAYYHSHGTHDSVLNYDSMGMPLAQNFAKANGCTWAAPTKVSSGTHVCTNLTGCTAGYPLEFCSFNGDHTPYPDTGQSSGSWGPTEAWKFLNQF